jgi:hypothetical protein
MLTRQANQAGWAIQTFYPYGFRRINVIDPEFGRILARSRYFNNTEDQV